MDDSEKIKCPNDSDVEYPYFNLGYPPAYREMDRVTAPDIELFLQHPEFGIALDPYRLYDLVFYQLKVLVKENPGKFERCVDLINRDHPCIRYMIHMEMSGHMLGFLELVEALRNNYGFRFKPPFADIGSGPGNMLWWLMRNRHIPKGHVSLIEFDETFFSYAKTLMDYYVNHNNPGSFDFNFMNIDAANLAEEAAKRGIKYNSVFSSLVLQFVENPGAIIRSIYQSLNPGGAFVSITEEPPDVAATTPFGITFDSFDIPHAKPKEEIDYLCEDAGFVAENEEIRPMGMELDIEEIIKRQEALKKGELSQQEIAQHGLKIRNFHFAFATVWRKPK